MIKGTSTEISVFEQAAASLLNSCTLNRRSLHSWVLKAWETAWNLKRSIFSTDYLSETRSWLRWGLLKRRAETICSLSTITISWSTVLEGSLLNCSQWRRNLTSILTSHSRHIHTTCICMCCMWLSEFVCVWVRVCVCVCASSSPPNIFYLWNTGNTHLLDQKKYNKQKKV